jgi:AbrB family looped-hinge helix DNA binding protein
MSFQDLLSLRPLTGRLRFGSAAEGACDEGRPIEQPCGKIVLPMRTRVSTKGQVVLPEPLRRRLGIRAGDPLEAGIEAGRIVLTPATRRPQKARIVTDPVTGLPVLHAGPDAQTMTSREVREILATFP